MRPARIIRPTFAALAFGLLALAPFSSTPAGAAVLSTRQRYALPTSVAGCRPTVYSTSHLVTGSMSVRYSCHPQGHPGSKLFYTVNVANPSPEAAGDLSDAYRTSFASPFVDSGKVHLVGSASTPFWGVIERGPELNRVSMGGHVHRVAFVVTVAFVNPDDGPWAIDYASKVGKAILNRVP
jgi:hypothetical protein